MVTFQQTIESKRNSKKPGLPNRWLLNAASIVASTAIASGPSLAGTLSFSGSTFFLDNFSHKPNSTSALADTNTFTNAKAGGSVSVLAEANAIFNNPPGQPASAFNKSSSLGLGEGINYFGEGQSKGAVIGNFYIGEGENFSFNFSGSLELNNSIDTPIIDKAKASGSIAFLLVDTTDSNNMSVLDYFTLDGKLSTNGIDAPLIGLNDFVRSKKSEYVKLTEFDKETSFGITEESIDAFVEGSYQRSFKKNTNLTLVEVKVNQTEQSSETLVDRLAETTNGLIDWVETLTNELILKSLKGVDYTKLNSFESSISSKGNIQEAIDKNSKAKDLLLGLTQSNPLLPAQTVEDWQIFSDVTSGSWFDPPTTYGFEFETTGDTLFTSILDFPKEIDLDDSFTVAVGDKILGEFKPGDSVDFVSLLGKGVSKFTITGIDSLLGEKVTDLPIRLAFNSNKGSFRMKAFDEPNSQSIPESGTVFSLLAFGAFGAASILKSKQKVKSIDRDTTTLSTVSD